VAESPQRRPEKRRTFLCFCTACGTGDFSEQIESTEVAMFTAAHAAHGGLRTCTIPTHVLDDLAVAVQRIYGTRPKKFWPALVDRVFAQAEVEVS